MTKSDKITAIFFWGMTALIIPACIFAGAAMLQAEKRCEDKGGVYVKQLCMDKKVIGVID